MRTRIREAATKDGLPRKAFAYAPEADTSTWKLPYLKADGTVDEDRLPGAVASLSPGGFRGEKADIPAEFLPMVKAKLRSAYRKWKGSDVEYPATITEAAYIEGTCYGCNHPTACDCTDCPCGQHVSEALSDVAQALDALEDLYALLDGEAADGDTEGAALIQQAIDAVLRFIPVEGAEITRPTAVSEAAVTAFIEEAGKRNNASDQKLIQTIHDATHTLGAQHMADRTYAGMSEAEVVVDGAASPITFNESGNDGVLAVLLSEANATFDDATRTVTITPIKPGFGNKRDGFYYPKQTLREATEGGLFNNLKMFRNHPRKSDEKDLPERDVRDWFATSRQAEWNEASGEPRLPVVVHEEADYRRWKEAPEQIAFSIRGGGNARPGRVNGQDARVVESLSKVRSVDWVTEAGAGGAIAFAESAAEEFDMDIKTLTSEQLRAELRLREADGEEAPAAEGETTETTETTTTETTEEVVEAPAEGGSGSASAEVPAEAAPVGYVSRAEFDALVAKMNAGEIKESARKAIAAEMATSTLPRGAKEIVAARFSEAGWGNGFAYADEPALRGAVQSELKMAAKLLGATGRREQVTGLGGPSDDGSTSIREAVADRLSAKWGPEQMPKAYQTVVTAEDMGGETAPKVEREEDPAPVSEAAAPVQDRIAAKFGQ